MKQKTKKKSALSKILGSVREYKAATLATPLFMLGEVLMEILMPFVIAKFLSVEIQAESPDPNRIVVICLVLLGMAFLSLFFGVMAGKTAAKASAGFAKNLRSDMFDSVQRFSFQNIDKFSTSSLVTRMTTDVTNVQMSFMMIIRTAVRSPLMLIFAVIMAFNIDTTLPWIYVCLIPVLLFGLFLIFRKATGIFSKIFKKYDAVNASIQENVKGMRVVKAYVREEYETKKFEAAAEEVRSDFTKAEKILAFNTPFMQFIIYVAQISLIFGGCYLITKGRTDINAAVLSSLLTYSMQVFMSLMMLSMIFVMISMSKASVERIVEVLDEVPSVSNPASPVTEVADGSIDFDGVSFKYAAEAEKYALTGVDLHIKSGQTVGILGGTGSSKTTLISLISRLYDVSEGSVRVGGVDVREYDLDVLRQQVSVVLQKNVLFSGTIAENLRWGDENATDEELRKACRIACADEFIDKFPDGYQTHIEQGGTNVSGGQKQRLCIARAILRKPKIIIFDDSTSAVDTHTDAIIRKGLREEIPDTTKIIIAQRVSSVQDADLIVVLDNGKIDGMGTHEQLLASNQIYQEVYQMQNRVSDDDENKEGGAN